MCCSLLLFLPFRCVHGPRAAHNFPSEEGPLAIALEGEGAGEEIDREGNDAMKKCMKRLEWGRKGERNGRTKGEGEKAAS